MNYRNEALALLIGRRGCPVGSVDWNWRTRAAWKYLQMHMRKPPIKWTETPPKTTIGNAS